MSLSSFVMTDNAILVDLNEIKNDVYTIFHKSSIQHAMLTL